MLDMPDTLTITQVAAHLGLDPDTLRYYERHGVVPAPPRDHAGHRSYHLAMSTCWKCSCTSRTPECP